MKKLTILAVSVFASTASYAANTDIWVGRLTGDVQCEGQGPSTLGEAVSELESRGVAVKEAKVARLPDRLFCQACGCPEGSFNLVKAQLTEALEAAVEEGEWEMIKSDTKQGGHGDFRILPVAPFELQ